jgi:hypothetical protein
MREGWGTHFRADARKSRSLRLRRFTQNDVFSVELPQRKSAITSLKAARIGGHLSAPFAVHSLKINKACGVIFTHLVYRP